MSSIYPCVILNHSLFQSNEVDKHQVITSWWQIYALVTCGPIGLGNSLLLAERQAIPQPNNILLTGSYVRLNKTQIFLKADLINKISSATL